MTIAENFGVAHPEIGASFLAECRVEASEVREVAEVREGRGIAEAEVRGAADVRDVRGIAEAAAVAEVSESA